MTGEPSPGPARRGLTVVGWMECVDLPDLPLIGLKAKIDTGARTSALHATDIHPFRKGAAEWVRFATLSGAVPVVVEAPVVHKRWIKNTSGIPEERIVIRTRSRLGRRVWAIDLSLADRTNMTFPLIVGRSALKNRSVAVHTRKAFLVSGRARPGNRKDHA